MQDIDQLVYLLYRFYTYSGVAEKGLGYNVKSSRDFISSLINADYGVLLVSDENGILTGTIGGMLVPWMGDSSQYILLESWWWVNPESRGTGGRLIKSFEKEGREKGAKFLIMMTLDSDKEKSLETFYQRFGMQHLEHHYMKEL